MSQIEFSFLKVSKVQNCRLDRIDDLPFDFEEGACNTFSREQEIVMLCFDIHNGHKACNSFDDMRLI